MTQSDMESRYKINFIKIDCSPLEYRKDLCLASVANHFKLSQYRRSIFAHDFTVRYTSSLFLQIFIFNNFHNILNQIPFIVEAVRQNFNQFKLTKVSAFKSYKTNNIQASGYLKSCDFSRLHTDNIPSGCRLAASSDVQDYLPVPYRGEPPPSAQIIVLYFETGNLVRLNKSSLKYSVVADTVDNFLRLTRIWTALCFENE